MELNLYNFEEDEFNDSKYVLTSPRSLLACDMLKVKPAELLFKPLADFQDELLPTGIPLREIYESFDQHERERQRKLTECRNYRDRMIQDNMYKMMSSSTPIRNSHSIFDDGYRSSSSQDDSKYGNDKTESCSTESLQRQRTARILKESRNDSQKQLINSDSNYENNQLGERFRSTTPSKLVTFSPKRSNSPKPKKTVKSAKQRNKPTTSPHRTRNAWTGRSYDNFDDLANNLSKSMCVSDLTSWRPPDLQETYIHDKGLRKSLGYKNSSGKVTPRDERVLEAMYHKNQQEVDDERNRSIAQLKWEDERIQYERDKEISECHRRKLLAQRIAAAEEQQAYLRERQLQDEEELRKSIIERSREHDTKWKLSADRQQYEQDLRMREKKRRSMERKRSQEITLAEYERARQEVLREHKLNSELNVKKATMMRNNREFTESLRKKRRNQQERDKHEYRYRQLERESTKLVEELKETLEQKDAKTRLNQSLVANARDYTLQRNAKEREQKFSKLKRNQEKKEEAESEWRRSLDARRRVLESKAILSAAQTVELKSLKAQAEREEKEAKQRETYIRLQEEQELLRRDQRDAIAYKDTKIKLVQHHKDQVIDKVRSLAATSQMMREELKKKYGKDSFDKKVLETELQARIGRGPVTGTKNVSRVIIG